jgi:hypothetical protein
MLRFDLLSVGITSDLISSDTDLPSTQNRPVPNQEAPMLMMLVRKVRMKVMLVVPLVRALTVSAVIYYQWVLLQIQSLLILFFHLRSINW